MQDSVALGQATIGLTIETANLFGQSSNRSFYGAQA